MDKQRATEEEKKQTPQPRPSEDETINQEHQEKRKQQETGNEKEGEESRQERTRSSVLDMFLTARPYLFFFDQRRRRKANVMALELDKILDTFIVEMEKSGGIDFKVSAQILGGAADVYAIKVRGLKREMEGKKKKSPRRRIITPALRQPLRPIIGRVHIEDLFSQLNVALKQEQKNINRRFKRKRKKKQRSELELKDFLVPKKNKVAEDLRQTYEKIQEKWRKTGKPSIFEELLPEETVDAAVRILKALLYLSFEGAVSIWQSGEKIYARPAPIVDENLIQQLIAKVEEDLLADTSFS